MAIDIGALIAQLLGQQGPQAITLPPAEEPILPPGMTVPPLAPRPQPQHPLGRAIGDLYDRWQSAPMAVPPSAPPVPPMGRQAPPATMPLGPPRQPPAPARDEFPADATDVPQSITGAGRPLPQPAPPAVGPFTTDVQPTEAPRAAVGGDSIVTGALAAQAARGPSAATPATPAASPARAALRQPSLWDYIDTALAGAAGGRPVLSTMGERFEGRNATYDALIQRGASPELARAITLNPGQFSGILPSLFTPRTSIVNNRLVETTTGRVIADFSDQFRPVPEGTVGTLNQATGVVTPAPDLPGRRRDLSAGDIRTLRNEGSLLGNIRRLTETFRAPYGGRIALGDLNMLLNRNLPEGMVSRGERDAAQWWQDYNRNTALTERHELFGAALTPTEQAAWRAADINPNMNAETIRANLETRQRIMSNATVRYARSLVASGYDATAISEAFGVSPAELGIRPGGRRDDRLAPQTTAPAPAPAPQDAQPQEGTIIRNPRTGERRILRNGQWQPVP